MTDLNSLIDPSSGWTLWSVNAINNRGQIIGEGNLGAFLLTPVSVPEPSTLALLGVGAVSLLACAWQKRR